MKILPKPIFSASRSGKAGFTLLEIMVAIAIMAIVIIAVFKMISQTIFINSNSRFQSIAPFLAQGKLAEIESKSNESWSDGEGDFGEAFAGYTWKVRIGQVESDTLAETADRLREINVIVAFNNDENIYNLKTYRFLPQ